MADGRCLACGSDRVEPWATARDVEYAAVPESFPYVRCGECGALSIADVPRDRLSEIYPETYYSFNEGSASFAERCKQWLDRRMFRKLFGSMSGNALSVLDVGGGTGWLLDQARRIEPRLRHTVVVDLDASAEAIAKAAGHEFHLGRIEDFRTERKFDLILMLNLIEHVEDPVGVLRGMGELLTPQGQILIKTPNHDSLDARLFRHRSWGGYHCPRHWVIFTPESMERAARKAGLQVKKAAFTQGAPFWAVSMLEALTRRGWVRISRERPMCNHPLFGMLLAVFATVDVFRKPFSRTSQMFVHLAR